MNGLLRRDWQKEIKSGFAFFFGWRVTEVHTNGMKDSPTKGKRSVQLAPVQSARCCDAGSHRVHR